MKKKSIFRQLLIPMLALAAALPAVVLFIFTTSYEREIYDRNSQVTELLAGEIAGFLEQAFHVNEELSDNPSILSMDTKAQTPILKKCVERNEYLDLIYIQGTDGMQTGRSSGELADRSARWWFQQVLEEKESFISKSYYSVATGMPCASVFFPMYEDSDFKGVYAADLKLDFLQELIGKNSDKADGRQSFVIDGEGVVVAHPDQVQIEEQYNYKDQTRTVSVKDNAGNATVDADGNIVTQQHPLEISKDMEQVITQVMAGGGGSEKISYDGKAYYASYATISLPGKSDSWSLITLQKKSAAMAMVNRMLVIAAGISLLAAAFATFFVLRIARKLASPVLSLSGLMKEAAEGDFSVLAAEDSQNEVGQLAKSYNVMAGRICGALIRMRDFTKDLLNCSDNLQAMESKICALSDSMQEISDGTAAQTLEVNQVVEQVELLEEKFSDLKLKSGELLAEAEHTIKSSEEGALSIRKLEERNKEVTDSLEQSFEKIRKLEEHSANISDIVRTIGSISSETELLALNASIEAARAGVHGRGFAVVAESVGTLASDSSKASSDIEAKMEEFCNDIQQIVAQTKNLKQIMQAQIEAVQKTEEIFLDFTKTTEQTGSFAGDMDGLIEEMYESDRRIADAAQRICDISKTAEGLSEKVASSMEEELKDIQSGVESLTKVSSQMEREMEKFKLE